ncbi:hypothetical protein ACFWGD_02185 [Corynebacterium sp. NPDC060344]|uniref:hypothetical protein n=1 Tax=Corynebacterium sp. NPDC060344 TaxID=3347101 RepID=UPI0036527327
MAANQTRLWPRITRSISETIFQSEVLAGQIPPYATSHGQMTYGPTGGRAGTPEIERLRNALIDVARIHGFGTTDHAGGAGPAFDRDAAPVMVDHMAVTWEEAGQPGVWSMISLVILPDLTAWRWGDGPSATKERWICIDPTRHAWGRLWWQETVCRERPGLLEKFKESELNQFFERTSFTRHREFFLYFMEATAAHLTKFPRRTWVRDVTKRMRRRLAFIDTFSLTTPELQTFVDDVVRESLEALR